MPDAATIPPDQTQYVPGAPIPLENTAASRALAASVPSGGAGQQQPAPPSNNPYDAYVQKQAAAGKEPPLAAGPAAQPSPPSENGGRIAPAQIEEYFVQKGLTPAQAKGMTRAFMEESGGDPDAFNPAAGGQGAAGLAQWRAARQQRLVSQYGPRPTAQNQLDFAWQELNTTEKPAFDAVRQASSEGAAYEAFKSKFERPGPPAGEMKAGATPSFQEFMQRNEEMQKTESESLQKVLAEAGKEAPGSQERHQAMQQAMEHSARLAQTFEDIAAHPPTATPVDAIQNFGSLASVIGIFGGLLSRRPLTAALGAAGAAMQAKTANNDEQFNRAYKMWHDQTALVSQALSFQNQEINQIIADERLSESERQDKLSNVFRAWGMQHQLDQAALGNWAEVYKMNASLTKASNDLKYQQARIDYYHAQANKAQASGGAGLNQYGDPPDDFKKSGNPNHPPPGSNIPESVWDAATQQALTGKGPILGNSAAGRAQIQSALPWVLAARGMTAADMATQTLSYQGALAGSKTLGTRLANLNVGLSEVPHLGEQLVKVSNETPRTQLMNVNQLLQAAELRTGDPQIVRLGAAINSYLQSYARAINPTGVISDDMRAHADFVLNQAMAKGQIQAGVDQLNKELTAMLQGLQDAAERGKTMFPLPGEPKPADPSTAPAPGSVPIPQPKYHAKMPDGSLIYSEDGTSWYDKAGVPITVH